MRARRISFALTTPQFIDESKDVTRRLRWLNLKPGMMLMGCEKAMGIPKGGHPVDLGYIEVVKVHRERLDRMTMDPDYGREECRREGFPDLSPQDFVDMFCRHMKCLPSEIVTRIEFKHRDDLTLLHAPHILERRAA